MVQILERFRQQLERQATELRTEAARQNRVLEERSRRLETLSAMRDSYAPARAEAGRAGRLVHRLEFMSRMNEAVRAEAGRLDELAREVDGLRDRLAHVDRRADRVQDALDARIAEARRTLARREQKTLDELGQNVFSRTRIRSRDDD